MRLHQSIHAWLINVGYRPCSLPDLFTAGPSARKVPKTRSKGYMQPLLLYQITNQTFSQKLCLRQNAIQEVTGLSCLAPTLRDLDLYDNLIAHIKGVEDLVNLTSLDLSFNKIKHIKRV